MPLRTRIILVAVAVPVLAVVWFVLVWRPSQNRVNDLRRQQEAARTERAQLEARLERLRQLQRDEPALRAQLARLDEALPLEPRIPDFILQVQEAANLAGVPFLSISPSLPSPFTPPAVAGAAAPAGAGPVQAVSVSITTTGKFFELEDFIVRMERLSRAVRVNTFSLAPSAGVGGTSPTISVSFAMQIFVSGAALTPGTQATPAPAATPAPGASPGAPTPTPAA